MTREDSSSPPAAPIPDGSTGYLGGKIRELRRVIRLLDFYSYGLKRYLFLLLVFSVLLGIMETFQIVLLYPIMNATIDFQGTGLSLFEPLYAFVRNTIDLPDIVAFSLLFIVLVFLTFIVTLVYNTLSLYFTRSVILKTKSTIFAKLIRNDYQYYVENKRGDILYNVVTAPTEIRHFLETSTLMFSETIIIATIVLTMLFVSVTAVTVILAAGLLFVLMVREVGKRVAFRLGRLQMRSTRAENEVINSYVQGLRQIRSVSGDGYWQKKYQLALDDFWDKYIRYNFFKQLPGATLQFIFFTGIAVLIIILYYLYQDRFLYVIPLMGTFVFSALKIIPRLSSMSTQYMSIMDDWPNLETIYQFLNDSRYHNIRDGTRTFSALTSDLSFDHVGFSYYKDQHLIEGITITISRKKITALVGHSGSGKSTIVSLLLRYYDVGAGRILVNGYDLREFRRETFLQKVGYVSQDTFIYNASIRENIAFGGTYSDEEITSAAQKANIHTFIAGLPDGYASIVGDQGIKLSGGEKQRIAIARALVRDPEILVLDEATSNLDNESEAIVQESINSISEDITTFIIAHRLSTIRKADMIYVMSKGKIVERGTHEELMDRKGAYFELYESEG
jgi:ABC-type multidrug transport system fused ATPase/permease subunit